MFTSDEYRTAAKVFAQEFGEQWAVHCLQERADRAAEREHYLHRLGTVGLPEDSAIVKGAKMLLILREDGWTPPDGLSL